MRFELDMLRLSRQAIQHCLLCAGYGFGRMTPLEAVSRKHGKQTQLMPQNQPSQKASAASG
jgi:hypothetical protein